jgi:hypothetical protein
MSIHAIQQIAVEYALNRNIHLFFDSYLMTNSEI